MPASAKPNLLVDATRLSAWITGVSSRATLEVDHPVSVPRHRRHERRPAQPSGRTDPGSKRAARGPDGRNLEGPRMAGIACAGSVGGGI